MSVPGMQISHEHIVAMRHRARRQIDDVLALCLNTDRTVERWTCLRRGDHLELYARKKTNGMSSAIFYLGMNEAACGFDEVFDLLNYDTTARFRLVMKLMFGKDFKDGALISSRAASVEAEAGRLSDGTLSTYNTSLWFAFQDRGKAVIAKEKVLTFYQTLTTLLPERPRNGMDCVVHKRTMALSWLPFADSNLLHRNSTAKDIVRLQYTLIIEEVSRDRLRLSCVTRSCDDDDTRSQGWNARMIARRLVVRSVTRLEAAVVASRISDRAFVSQHEWVKNEDRVSCVICWKSFNAFYRRRHHCRVCGEVICGSCCSLRRTNVMKKKEFQKVRVCHLCSNKGRVKADSFASTAESMFPGHQPAMLDDEMPITRCLVPPPPSNQLAHETIDLLEERDDYVDEVDRYPGSRMIPSGIPELDDDDDESYDGYIGEVFSNNGRYSSQKLISIKSLTSSEVRARMAMPPPSSNRGASPSVRHPPAPLRRYGSAENQKSKKKTVTVAPPPHSVAVFHIAHSGWNSRMTDEPKRPRPLLVSSSQSLSFNMSDPPLVSPSHSFSLASTDLESRRTSLNSIGQLDDNRRTSLTSVGQLDEHRRTSLTSVSQTEDNRRTSLITTGYLDGYVVDEKYFVPKLDPSREARRLKLMKTVCSPACTLIDRVLMRKCCEIVSSTFGVSGAFIARVEKTEVFMEHTMGVDNLFMNDRFFRHDTLCDYVIVQPPHRPLVIADCAADPRTKDNFMVKQLEIKFFVGTAINVHGLPIACVCAFGKQNEEPQSSHYNLTILDSTAHSIEAELERLVLDLQCQ
ncbi:TPA: hypothetical protein N0F65_001438 [Lagenidium giganteum]|uniref:FYVE-type domain-containing protein n=1 Tax=Lagenidium giganteum TaxID=4803 RepID=A0AAV2YZW6_9STRA|nr:TPA: hypothetical protein N0F65_001438 [Lagenidium giganteum]